MNSIESQIAAMSPAELGAAQREAMMPQVRTATSFSQKVTELYRHGLPRGDPTGWSNVDELYTVVLGMLTIVTGWPGSGKSEWLDALFIHLARDHGWRIALFSAENMPQELHIAKLLEKLAVKPFGHGPSERISPSEVAKFSTFLDEHFGFLVPNEITVDGVLDAASEWMLVNREHKRGLVIDPWNELEHLRPSNMSETEYIGQSLTTIRRWARNMKVHVWIVAHPQKLRRLDDGKLPVPTPDSISGSQHWWNKADYCITVWRDQVRGDPVVDINVQKVRWKHTGRSGVATLFYDRLTGTYRVAPGATRKANVATSAVDDAAVG
jgi:twinkle protein